MKHFAKEFEMNTTLGYHSFLIRDIEEVNIVFKYFLKMVNINCIAGISAMNVSPTERMVLTALQKGKETCLKDLQAKVFRLSTERKHVAALSCTVSSLVKKGFVSRTPSVGLRKEICLTKEGSALL